ncbi:MAG: DNA-directed RNA polymerase [Thermoprotei archaeon]|nr:DNA-directed RNA polymerase [Thermoprotei archaeon]
MEYEIEEWVGVPPDKVYGDQDLNASILSMLRSAIEGTTDPELGVIIAVLEAQVASNGVVLPISGDPNVYYLVRYRVLAFEPVLQEVLRGVVKDVKDQGIFVDIGPVDAFVHRSQISDESLEMLPDRRGFKSIDTGRIIETGDLVRARITQISRPTGGFMRIGMTMRQPYLGKEEQTRRG